MDGKSKLLAEVLSSLRAVLISVKGQRSIRQVARDYQMLTGEDIPFKRLGYGSLNEFVVQEKAFRTVMSSTGELMVEAKLDEKSAHIVEMVGKQKSSKPKGGRSRSQRFAPVRNNVSSNRVPSSKSNWKPQNLTPTKDKKVYRKKSIRSTNDLRDTLTNRDSIRPTNDLRDIVTSRDKPTIVYKGVKSNGHSRQNSVDHGDTETHHRNVSRENSIEVKQPKKVSRQSSLSKVDLLKNIPQELLRDVPCTDISFDEILHRTFMSRGVKSPSPSTTDSSSIVSNSDVTDLENTSSVPPSPLGDPVILSDVPSHKVPRGRGRFMKSPSDEIIPIFPTVDIKPNIPNTPKSTVTPLKNFQNDVLSKSVFHTPTNPASKNEQLLCDLLNDLHLEYKPVVKTLKRQPKIGPPLFDASIKIGPDVKCSTWPTEYTSAVEATEAVLGLALIEAQNKYAHVMRLPISSPHFVGTRLIPLISQHPTGVWSDNVQQLYLEHYDERLPQNWLLLADKAGIQIEYAANEKFILTYSPDSGIPVNGNFYVDAVDDFNVTITEPELPRTEEYLSVVITCANSTTDISFRIIGTTLAERYKRLTTDIEEYYSNKQETINPAKITVGGYYAVQNNNTWMRIRILEEPQPISGTSIELLEVLCSFVDHGHEYPVPLNKMYELPNDFRNISAQAIHCSLVGLEEVSDSEVALPYLEELVGKHMYLKNFETDDSENLSVVLFDTSGDEDVNVNLDIMQRLCDEAQTPSLKTDDTIQEMEIVYADSNGFVYMHQGDGSQIFFDLMNKVSARFNEIENHEFITSVDEIEDVLYLIKHSDDNFYRCAVTKVLHNQNSVVVNFIDYGQTVTINFNVEKTKLVKLSLYSHLLLNLPPQCIKAQLYHNIAKVPANTGEKLLLLIGDIGSVLVKVLVPADKPSQIPIVELFRRSETDDSLYSINKKLNLLMRMPKMEDGNNNTGKVKKQITSATPNVDMSNLSISSVPSTGDIPKPNLPKVGDLFNVHIPWAVNPWNFFIQPYENGKEFNQWMFTLQDYYNRGPGSKKVNLSLDDIHPGQCYAAQHSDHTWYRACVNQTINGDSISAFFVDYGQYVVLCSKQLQPLHSNFKTKPFQAIKAQLSGIRPQAQKWQVEDCQKFQELVVNKFFVAKIMEIGRDVLHSSDIVLGVKLIDTTTDDDIYIHQLLINQGIAV